MKIGFKVSGILVDLEADVGDRVVKGAVLARLDSREQQAQVARAKAAIEQGEANLQRSMASVEKAKANYANAQSINQRRQKLVQSNVASVEETETAKTAQDAALADLNLANSDVAVAQAAIDDAKANMQLQGATLDFHTLTAPYDALVITRSKELGDASRRTIPSSALSIQRQSGCWPISTRARRAKSRSASRQRSCCDHSRTGAFAGHVARIEPESDRVNEERRVEVAFDPIPDNINLGEQAEVYITTLRLAQALMVPEAAITGLARIMEPYGPSRTGACNSVA